VVRTEGRVIFPPMRFDFVTLFPELVMPAMAHGVIGKAIEKGLISHHAHDPRDFATDLHKTVDDKPFGGGPGMVLKPDLVGQAVDQALDFPTQKRKVVIMEPWGERFSQRHAKAWTGLDQLILICGRYEGIDARVAEHYQAEAISLGDFVLTGGELAALTIADAVARLLPGVLGDQESLDIDSFSNGLLAAPQYTRPWEWNGLTPPKVLKTGNHAKVERWKKEQSIRLTLANRPDLFATARLDDEDVNVLSSWFAPEANRDSREDGI
jgi:tRNA (guanine37-N1)-methyltransferase